MTDAVTSAEPAEPPTPAKWSFDDLTLDEVIAADGDYQKIEQAHGGPINMTSTRTARGEMLDVLHNHLGALLRLDREIDKQEEIVDRLRQDRDARRSLADDYVVTLRALEA